MIKIKGFLSAILAFIFSISAFSQSIMDRADEYCGESLSNLVRNRFVSVKWINRGGHTYFYYSEEEKDGSESNYIVDTKNWKPRLLFNNVQLSKELDSIIGDKEDNKVGLYAIDFDPKDISIFTFTKNKHYFSYNWKNKELKEIERVSKKRKYKLNKTWNRKYSADSLYWIDVMGNNLFINTDRTSIQLTYDGEQEDTYGLRGMDASDTTKRGSPIGMWVGNSHKFILVKKDKRNVRKITLVNNLSKDLKTVTYDFPMPGDSAVYKYSVYLVDADKPEITRLRELEKYKDQQIVTPRFGNYVNKGSNVYFLRTNRVCDTLDLCKVNVETGEVKTLISEECKPHYNEFMFSYHILNNGKDILWWSERTGKGKYYHYDGEGKLLNPTMKADFVSGPIVRIDSLKREFIFSGYGADENVSPDYAFYYRGSIDGKFEPVLLTPGNGMHTIEFSPNKKWIFDSFSRVDMVPHYQICDMKGKVKYTLPAADPSELFAKGWQYPKLEQCMAADSTTKLYGIVYLPFDLDTTRKYPLIVDVYPGPQTDLLPDSFVIDDNCDQCLAQLGFVVIKFSYRGGNPHRGKAYFDYGYGNLRDYPLEDNYAVIQQLAKKYPFIDLDRVGIYGHSGGGFMTVAAMLDKPDFFKVGISVSGNHDNNIYTKWWGESFHGGEWTVGKDGKPKFQSKIPTNIENAAKLNGRLLLITGDMDNNVHPANSFRMANALIKNGKRFDMLVIPGADHGMMGAYYENTIRYYFVEHLLGLPQKEINIIKHK